MLALALTSNPPRAPGMASDIGGKRVAATMTAADIDRVSKLEGQAGDGSGKAGAPTSQLPKDAIAGHTGMASHMLEGQPHLKPHEEETRPHQETQIISKYLSDQWYGRFYWDAGECRCRRRAGRPTCADAAAHFYADALLQQSVSSAS